MRAFTYYAFINQDRFKDERTLASRWEANWQRHKWETVVLTEADARLHPSWDLFARELPRLPTTNPQEYERACWVRWLAWAARVRVGEISLFTDYDVFNAGFEPTEASRRYQAAGLVNLDSANGSGPFVADKDQVVAIPPVLLTLSLMHQSVRPDTKTWSDMMVWNLLYWWKLGWVQREPVCEPLHQCAKAQLVHISNHACHEFHGHCDKLAAWDKLEAPL